MNDDLSRAESPPPQPATESNSAKSTPVSLSLSTSERLFAVSHYIPFFSPLTCFYCLLKHPTKPFSLIHMQQGLALFLIWFFWVFILALFPSVGFFLLIFLLPMTVWGTIQSYQGKNNPIPVLSSLGKFLPLEKLYSQMTGKPWTPN